MNNNYKKQTGTRPMLAHVPTPQSINKPINVSNILPPEGYTKTSGTQNPSQFVIISGGEKREADYFKYLRNRHKKFPRVAIEFICESSEKGHKGLNVKELVAEGLKIKATKDKSKGSDVHDSIYLISDVDHFYADLKDALPICITNNLQLIVSNPCFEIWLYYSHYQEYPASFELPENGLEISAKFKTWLNTIHKGGIDPRKAILNIEDAIKNAENQFRCDAYGLPVLHTTQMFQLAQQLYPFIDTELQMM